MRKFLKTTISILTIIFILMTILTTKVKAVDTEGQITMDIESASSVKIGEEITIKVKINKNDSGVLGAQGRITYDKNAFELVETKALNENLTLSAFNEENGMFMLEITNEAFNDSDLYIYDETEVLEVKLKAKQDSGIRKTDFQVSEIKVVDSSFETIDVENTSKKIRIRGNGLSITSIVIIVVVIIVAFALAILFIRAKKGKMKSSKK